MKNIPGYTKILTLGSAYTSNALVGDVIIQEKIDGSQFRIYLNEEGELSIGSKGTILGHPDENKMFKEGVEYILSIEDKIKEICSKNTILYGEYLQRPKHNVLKYERTPQNHIVLFDCISNGKYLNREALEAIAEKFDIDLVPELYKGQVDIEKIKELLTTPSYLGNETVEGVVIKNYNQTLMLGGNIFPLFTKYVNKSFKERHEVEWKIKRPKDSVQDYIQEFKSEARWQKAIIHLREKGELEQSPRDIGKLIEMVKQDIIEEESENIKNYLYKKFIDDIKRVSVQGVAEWYKEKLLENLNGGN